MSDVLVTGGCGFIGSHLCWALKSAGHHVVVLDNLSTGNKQNLPPDVELHVADVNKAQVLDELLKKVDVCFHLAAIASVEICSKNWLKSNDTNLRALLKIFDASKKATKKHPVPVIYASSTAVYGNPTDIPLVENSIIRPISGYGADKAACELYANVASTTYNIPNIGLRLFNVYGPKQNPNSMYTGVITKFMNQIMDNQPLTIFGDGSQVRDFVYVSDVVNAFILAWQHVSDQPKVYNICSNNPTSILELVNIMSQITQSKAKYEFLPKARYDIQTSIGNNQKAIKELGFSPKFKLDEGLKLLWEEFQAIKVKQVSNG